MEKIDVKKENNSFKFTINVDQKTWEDQQTKTKKELVKNVSIKGFRKGKVPFDIAVKHLSQGDILTRSLDKIIEPIKQKIEQSEQFKNQNDNIVEVPNVNVDKISETELVLTYIYDLFPDVEIEEYKSIKIDGFEHKVADENDVDNEIKRILKNHSKTIEKPSDATLQNHDIANIDFVGYKNNEKFAGGEAKDFDLTIGSKKFVANFEEQLIGMKVNDIRRIEVTFPKDYGVENLAGVKTEFEVKLNKIKQLEIPELNDEFVKKEKIANVNTVKEFKEYIKKQIQAQFDLNYRDAIIKEIIKFVISITKLSYYPDSLVNVEKRRIINALESQLKQQNLDLEKYLKLINMSKQTFEQDLEKNAKDSLAYAFGIEQIGLKEQIQITDQDLDEYYKKVSIVYGMKLEEVKKTFEHNIQSVKDQLLNEKIIDKLIIYNEKNLGKKK